MKCAGNDDIITMKATDDADTVSLVFESPSKCHICSRVAKPHEFFVRLTKISSMSRSPESSANLTKI